MFISDNACFPRMREYTDPLIFGNDSEQALLPCWLVVLRNIKVTVNLGSHSLIYKFSPGNIMGCIT